MSTSDIIVVGGGMVGLASAGLFAREGFQVALLDSGSPAPWSTQAVEGRVSAINPASRNLLAHIGVWDTIQQERVLPYTRMSVWDSDSAARITFDAAEEGVAALGYIVENNLISHCLRERLAHNYNVTLLQDARVTGFRSDPDSRKAVVEIDGRKPVQGDLVVAADGAHSSLRALAGIDISEQDFQQDAITATLVCSKHHGNTAFQVFTPSGPVAMLPLSDSRCSLVWSRDRDDVDEILSMDEDTFCKQLESQFSVHLGHLELAGPRMRFPLHSRHARCYVADQLALVGDAAHTIHPLAGLGVNLGMQDAAALVETVTTARQSGKKATGRSVLRRYERWRRGENGAALRAMQGFKSTFGTESGPVRQIRAAAFLAADQIAPLKHVLAQLAMGTRGDLPAACLPVMED